MGQKLAFSLLLVATSGMIANGAVPNNQSSIPSFLELCNRQNSLSPAQQHTIKVLLEKAGTANCQNTSNYLRNLTSLDLQENQISDVTPLSNLTNLTSLDLVGTQITDVTPLGNLTNLTDLSLWGNQISDVTPLGNLTNLTILNLRSNQIKDVTPLRNLTNLTSLDLEGNPIQKIPPSLNRFRPN